MIYVLEGFYKILLTIISFTATYWLCRFKNNYKMYMLSE